MPTNMTPRVTPGNASAKARTGLMTEVTCSAAEARGGRSTLPTVMARICPEAASRSRAPCVVSERVLNSASWEPVASSELASAKTSRSFCGLLMSGANEASDSVPNSSLAMPACSASGIFLMAPSTVSRVFSASLPPFFMPSAMALTLLNPNRFMVSF